MATKYPDNLWVDAYGNLTLGTNGNDDAAGHATYFTFKNDVEFTVSPADMVSDTQPALTYDATRTEIPVRVLAASTTHKLLIPFPQFLLRTFVPTAGWSNGVTGTAATSKGILVKSLALRYRADTTTLTSATLAVHYKAFATEDPLGAVTTPAGAVTGNTLTADTNVYTMLFTLTTPLLITATNSMPWAVATIVTPGSSTASIFEATWSVALGLY